MDALIKKAIRKIEEIPVTPVAAAATFFGIVFIRFFFENFSSQAQSFSSAPDGITLVHYALFYLAAYLAVALVLGSVARDVPGAMRFTLLGFPLIWTAPLVDLAFSHGAGIHMAYAFSMTPALLRAFVSLGYAGGFGGGITPGIKVELICIIIGSFLYLRAKTGRPFRAAAGAIAAYAAVFFLLAFPGAIAVFVGVNPVGLGQTVQSSFIAALLSSRALALFLRPVATISFLYAEETAFSLGISYFYFLLITMLLAACAWMADKERFRALMKNCRPGRIAHYLFLIAAGMVVGAKVSGLPIFLNGGDVAAACVLAVGFVCAWLFSVGLNDIADVGIDRLSNQGRPLVNGALTRGYLNAASWFLGSWAVIGFYLAGYWAMFAGAVFIALYYVYSMPPLRLKRVPMVSSLLVALAGLAAFAAGFFFADAGGPISDLPRSAVLLVLICYTLGANIKDIKDAEGDAAEGIMTIPVLAGEGKGKMIVGALWIAAAFAVPVILGSRVLFIPALLAAAAGYACIVARRYSERKIFAVYFAYFAVVAVILLF